jgi:hypothetical protein
MFPKQDREPQSQRQCDDWNNPWLHEPLLTEQERISNDEHARGEYNSPYAAIPGLAGHPSAL